MPTAGCGRILAEVTSQYRTSSLCRGRHEDEGRKNLPNAPFSEEEKGWAKK